VAANTPPVALTTRPAAIMMATTMSRVRGISFLPESTYKNISLISIVWE
jgi:hypothetical protein